MAASVVFVKGMKTTHITNSISDALRFNEEKYLMSNEYKTILFTSNLSTAGRVAFKQALLLANQFGAKLVLLHVMERLAGSYEGYMIGLFGQDKWHQVLKNNKEEAKHALVGKVSPKQMARTALSEFCKENEIEEEGYVIPPSEIVVKEGDVVEVILEQAVEHKCDLIVMGASEGLLSGSSVGNNIKSVLKKSEDPGAGCACKSWLMLVTAGKNSNSR